MYYWIYDNNERERERERERVRERETERERVYNMFADLIKINGKWHVN